jgi:hypothetical protein
MQRKNLSLDKCLLKQQDKFNGAFSSMYIVYWNGEMVMDAQFLLENVT